MQTQPSFGVRSVVFTLLCVALSGCLGNSGVASIDAPPRIEISIFKPAAEERVPFTLVFAAVDAEREGFPTEIPFEVANNGGPDRATFLLENRTVETTETRLDLPCFEEPIQVRNDLNGEVVHTQDDFCPRGTWHDDWRFFGIYDDSEQITLR